MKCEGNMWFGVLTAVNAKISILRYVTPCSVVVMYVGYWKQQVLLKLW